MQPQGSGKSNLAQVGLRLYLDQQWSVVVGSSQRPRLDWLPSVGSIFRRPRSPVSLSPPPQSPAARQGFLPKPNLHPTTRQLFLACVPHNSTLFFLVTGFSRRFFLLLLLGLQPQGATCANRLVSKVRDTRFPLSICSLACPPVAPAFVRWKPRRRRGGGGEGDKAQSRRSKRTSCSFDTTKRRHSRSQVGARIFVFATGLFVFFSSQARS